MAQITNFDLEIFFIHTLELKLRLLDCSPYVCIGKPCICNVSRLGVHYLETCSKLGSLGYLLALYGSTMYLGVCIGLWTIFFSLSVSACLKKKKIF